jgi:hypothetical protein
VKKERWTPLVDALVGTTVGCASLAVLVGIVVGGVGGVGERTRVALALGAVGFLAGIAAEWLVARVRGPEEEATGDDRRSITRQRVIGRGVWLGPLAAAWPLAVLSHKWAMAGGFVLSVLCLVGAGCAVSLASIVRGGLRRRG